MDAPVPQYASQADLARIARFNETDAAFPDNVTIQELIEARPEIKAPPQAGKGRGKGARRKSE